MNTTVPRLVLVEARRVSLHPALSAVLVASVLVAGRGDIGNATKANDILSLVFLFLLPLSVPFAANLVASSARRAGAEELYAALPVSPGRRAAAVCAGGVGPAVLALAAGAGLYAVTHSDGIPADVDVFTGWHLATLPLVYLGGAAYGVAVARWLPWPGTALVAVIALFAWFGFTHTPDSPPAAVVTAPYYLTSMADGVEGTGAPGASEAWHAAYLLCLVLAAGVAAALRERPRAMLAWGGLIGALAAVCTVLTLP